MENRLKATITTLICFTGPGNHPQKWEVTQFDALCPGEVRMGEQEKGMFFSVLVAVKNSVGGVFFFLSVCLLLCACLFVCLFVCFRSQQNVK